MPQSEATDVVITGTFLAPVGSRDPKECATSGSTSAAVNLEGRINRCSDNNSDMPEVGTGCTCYLFTYSSLSGRCMASSVAVAHFALSCHIIVLFNRVGHIIVLFNRVGVWTSLSEHRMASSVAFSHFVLSCHIIVLFNCVGVWTSLSEPRVDMRACVCVLLLLFLFLFIAEKCYQTKCSLIRLGGWVWGTFISQSRTSNILKGGGGGGGGRGGMKMCSVSHGTP